MVTVLDKLIIVINSCHDLVRDITDYKLDPDQSICVT